MNTTVMRPVPQLAIQALLLDELVSAGQLDAEEFVELVLSKARSPDEEMQRSWSFFDVNSGAGRYHPMISLLWYLLAVSFHAGATDTKLHFVWQMVASTWKS